MPTYSYRCANCDVAFDQYQAFTDDTLTVCPNCGEPQLRKVFNTIGVTFNGSGFYRNDSRASQGGNGKGGQGKNGSDKASSGASGKSDSAKSESSSSSSSSSSSGDSAAKPKSEKSSSTPAAKTGSGSKTGSTTS